MPMKVLLVKPYTQLKVAKRLQEGFLHLEPHELEITAAGVDKKHITRILDLEDYVYFVDDEMFINIKRVTKIAQLLKQRNIQKKNISWARSDTIAKHPEVFKLWKEVGLDVVYVGLESMDQKRLENYNKKTGSETNQKAIKILKYYGIMLHAAFIVHPDFDKNDFKRLEEDVIALCPSEITFTVLSPSPGTPLFENYKDQFICNPFKYYDCMHTVITTNMTIKQFYKHFGRLYAIALRSNPLRVNKIKVKLKDFFRAVILGTRYVFFTLWYLQRLPTDYAFFKKR